MRLRLLLVAALAVATTLVSIQLWRELRVERQTAAALRIQIDATRTASTSSTAAGPVTPPVVLPAPETSATESPRARPGAAPTLNDSAAAAMIAGGFVSLDKGLMQDDEYRKAQLAQIRLRIQSTQSGLVAEMGLLETEAAALYDLLAAQMLARSELVLPSTPPGGSPDLAAMSAVARQQLAMQRDHEAELAALLGDFRHEQYRDYQQTLVARNRATAMSSSLAQMGLPLTSSQSRAMTNAMVNEFRRQQREPGPPPPLVLPTTPEARAQMTEFFMNRSLESSRQFLEAAAPHLGARQLQILRQEMEAQEQLSRASQRLQMQQLEQAMPAAPVAALP